MPTADRFQRVIQNAQEVVTEEELRGILSAKTRTTAYVGFELSGLAHLGGVIIANKLRDFTQASVKTTVLLADWHSFINDKFGGDWERIHLAGECLKDFFTSLGAAEGVEFLYASDLVSRAEYWRTVLAVAKNASLSRMKRALSIMGRREEDAELDSSKIIYPAMQVTDIHVLDIDIALGGMDQRHAHMLYRDLAPKLGWKNVVALHTPLLTSLMGQGRMDPIEGKMSKSRPDSAIFPHDSPAEIKKKIQNAYCPPGISVGNPVAEIWKYILFPALQEVRIERESRFGGDLEFKSYSDLESAYASGSLHPQDLKGGAAHSLAQVLEPARKYFEKHPENLNAIRGE